MYVIFRRRKKIMIREWWYQMPYGTDWQSGFFGWLYFFIFFYLRWRSWTSRDWPLLSTYPPAAPRVSCTESCTRSTWRSASSGGSKSGGSSVGKKMNLLLETNFHWLYMNYLAFFLRCVFFACLCSAFFLGGGCYFYLGGGGWFVGFFFRLFIFHIHKYTFRHQWKNDALTLIFVSGHGEKLSM